MEIIGSEVHTVSIKLILRAGWNCKLFETTVH